MPKTIITAALTGVLTTRAQSPAIPYTPEEIAEEARRSVEAGAGIVHIHARQDDGRPAYNVETYARINAAVRAHCPEVIINYSTGAVGVSREARVAHIATLRPDMAALNMGSMNYAIYSSKHKTFYHDHVFANPFADILFFLEAMNVAGTRPEMECFDTGHIHNAAPLIDMGMLRPPYQFSLIMGVLGGIPGTTKHLVQQVDNLPPGAHWQVGGDGDVEPGGGDLVRDEGLQRAEHVVRPSTGGGLIDPAGLFGVIGGAGDPDRSGPVAGPERDRDPEAERHRQHDAAVVVGVLAHQVDPAGREGDRFGRTAIAGLEPPPRLVDQRGFGGNVHVRLPPCNGSRADRAGARPRFPRSGRAGLQRASRTRP